MDNISWWVSIKLGPERDKIAPTKMTGHQFRSKI